jgi:glycosyltransferase involved in cell wall biosynthesis
MKFSVIIPVYAKESEIYFDQSLKSILCNQSLKPNEVLIIEDGEIGELLDMVTLKYQAKYPDIVNVIKLQKNVGMGAAMNVGLLNAKYEWIARMDSDDIASSIRFETQFNYLKNNSEVSVLSSNIEEFQNEIGDLKRFRAIPEDHEKIINMMKSRNPINHMSVVYKRDLAILAGGYWKYRYYEDYNLWYEIYKSGARFHNLNEVLVYARIGNGMVSRRRGKEYFLCEKRLYLKFKEDNFLTFFEYLVLLYLKKIVRSLPLKLLEFFYDIMLRK